MQQELRITSTLGIEIRIPLMGSLGAGIAMNSEQLGVYMATGVAPGSLITNAARIANAISNQLGAGDLVPQSHLAAWDAANGQGIALQGFSGVVGGAYLGTIENINNISPNGQISPDLQGGVALGAVRMQIVVSPDSLNNGSAAGSGITVGVGAGLGASIEAQQTFAVSLFGTNGWFNEQFQAITRMFGMGWQPSPGIVGPGVMPALDPLGNALGFPMEGPYADAARDAFGNAEQRQSPLVLDLDGDGLDLIALTNSKAFFDLDNDGFVERVGWVGADDGLLAIDLDANGLIEGRTELFGGSPSDGFASLRLLDSNADNLIDANDAEFANLKVWRDLNGNGVSDAGELQSLTDAGLASISLASVHLTTPQTIAGNSVTDTSTFTWTAGGTGTVADVWFSVNQAFSFDARPVEIVPEALFLPTLRGYGVISSLTAQMSRDPTLLEMVQDFVETPLTDVTDAQIRGIMYRWAGVDGIAPNARTVYGATIDSRKIVFLERFLDDPYTQTTYGSNASPTGVADLEAAFAAVFDAVKVRLLAQAQLSDVLGIGAFDYLSDSFVAGLDMQAVLSRAQATAIEAASNGAGTAATVAWWRAALPTLNAVAVDAGATEYATWLEAAVRASTGETYGVEDLYDNLIFGTSGADSLTAAGGNDTLDGREGNDLLIGGRGNDSLFGGTNYYSQSGNDTLIGGTGNDTMNGAQGDDLYVFARGDGQDRIYDSGGGIDTIAFAADILPSEVTLARTGANADDLLISIAGGDQIIVQGYFGRDYYSNYTYRIEHILFDDGTTWDYSTILAKVSAGGASNDTLYGLDATGSYNGIDTLDGGDGNDVLDGRTADDLLIGGAGNDSLFGGTNYYGESGNDTLVGGTGNDTMNGAQGDDLYVFARGDGQDRIYDSGGGIDTIAFAADILPSEVTLSRTGPNADDLLISIAGGDQITVQGYFGRDYYSNHTYRIEQIAFADGTSWDYATILAKVSTGGTGNDTIYGLDATGSYNGIDTLDGGAGNDTLDGRTADDLLIGGDGNDSLFGGTNYYSQSGNDTLIGGTGNDTMNGAQGDDLYVFARGDGQDRIYDSGGGIDTIAFAADILPSEVTLARTGTNADDLLISIAGGDQILVQGYFGKDYYGNYTYRIEEVRFADGATWDYATILAKVSGGTAGNDTLLGDDFANEIGGAAGNDRLEGRGGNDTLSGGSGADTLYGGNQNDVLQGDDGNDFLDGNDGDDVASGGADADTVYGGNGNDWLAGDEGNDRIEAHSGNDTLTGGTGNDSLYGGSGDDRYIFALGDGQDYIWEDGGADALIFAAGISPADVTAARASAFSNDLVLTFAGSPGDRVTIGEYFNIGNSYRRFEEVRFADGTVWDYATVLAKVLTPTAGNDTLWGDIAANSIDGADGNDRLDGNDGNDTLSGGAGSDTISGGNGHDQIFGGEDNDTLDGGGGDDTLQGGAGNDSLQGWDGHDFIDGGAGDDRIDGSWGNDTIIGGTGNDYMYDGSGDAIYIFDVGDGNDTVSDQNGGTDSIVFGAGITAANTTVRYVGNNMILTYGGASDQITVLNHAASSNDRIEFIKFDDGTVWDYAAMTTLATTGTGANDTLQGDHGANAIYGHGGDDSLVGRDGNDTIHAGDGNDTVYAGNHNDLIYGGAGDNRIWAENGDDTVYVEDGNDYVDLTWGNDYADLGEGNNTLYGGDGNDTIVAGSGSDSLMAGNHSDLVHAGGGHDRVWGEGGEDTIHADGGDDFVDGQWGNDLIYLGNGNDTGWGGDQNDAIYGEAGNDTLDGGNHDDTLVGGTGNDWMRGSWGNDLILYAAGDGMDTINEDGGGSDTLLFAAGIDSAQVKLLKSGNDLSIRIDGTPAILIQNQFHGNGNYVIEQIRFNDGTVWNYAQMLQMGLIGTEDDDTISGTGSPDSILGLGGNDSLAGYAGIDTLDGGAGNDTIDAGDGDDLVLGGDGNDSLFGGNGNDTIQGGMGADIMSGGANNDVYLVSIGQGADTIIDSGGSDTLVFGADILVSDVSITRVGSTSDVLITIAGGLGTILVQNQLGGGNAVDQIRFDDGTIWTPADIAARAFTGTEGNDTVVGTTTAEAIYGLGGNDSLMGGTANWGDWGADTIDGGLGDDTIATGNQHDLMFGGDGNDYMTSGAGNDTFWGGLGNDTAHGGDWSDVLFGEDGDDSLMGGFGSDSLVGGDGNDILRGDYDNDTLIGGAGHDVLDGGDNQDYLVGGEGNDSAYGSWSNDTIILGDGHDFADGGYDNDLIYGDNGNDTLWGGGSNDTIYGGNGDDAIDGGDHSDIMHGGDGNDVMTGNWGADTFVGGLGADIMSGQGENDIFRWDGVTEGGDTITDFGAGEKLQFAASAFGFTAGATLTTGVNYITGAAPAATDATPTFLYNTSNSTLYFDADGTGAEEAVNIVKFSNNHMLVASSFEFI